MTRRPTAEFHFTWLLVSEQPGWYIWSGRPSGINFREVEHAVVQRVSCVVLVATHTRTDQQCFVVMTPEHTAAPSPRVGLTWVPGDAQTKEHITYCPDFGKPRPVVHAGRRCVAR